MTSPRIEVHEDPEVLATVAAGALVARLADAQAAGRDPHVALTGGTIADSIHRQLARLAPDSEVSWSRVSFWWGDERYVPRSSPDRNAGQARAAFLDRVGVNPARVHEMGSPDSYESIRLAAAAYSDELRDKGSGEFEVVMLGIGPDGHVASLFPGSAALDAELITVAVTDSPKPPPERLTLTLGVLNRARAVWFVASGQEKADAVARALGDADPHDVPAAGVSGREHTVWFLDRAAASAL